MDNKKFYISVKTKFILMIIFVILWIAVCGYIEYFWYSNLILTFPKIISIIIILLLAVFPSIMICTVIAGIILDKKQEYIVNEDELEPITILIADYNEGESIIDTIKSLANQNYPNQMIIKIIDNNSTDNTKEIIQQCIKDFPQLQIEYIFEPKQGKFNALNTGLKTTFTRFVITLDADTFLYKDAILLLCSTMIQENKNKKIGAIAGTVLVRNSRENLLTKMQEWEYFLSIASIKRCQGLFQSVLVAQGAFSIYNTELVKQNNGWPDSIGEDIIVTWNILSSGARVYYCDKAIAFTNAPTKLKIFLRQRARWARGMIEGFKHFKFVNCKNNYAKFFIFLDLFLPLIDIGISCLFIPGIIVAIFFKKFWIVGPITLLLFPVNFILFCIMWDIEYNKTFKPLGLKVRKHYLALIIFILTYSLILSPTCIKGYLEELLQLKRKWK